MAAVLGEAWVEISAPLTRLGHDLSRAQSMVDRSAGVMSTRMGRFGSAMSSIGRKMTLGVTLPIIGYLGIAAKAAMDSEKATNDLNSALKTTGNYTKATSEELVKYSDELMKITVYDDELIRHAMAYGISLKGNANRIKEVTVAAIGLSHMFGMELKEGMAVAARGSEGIAIRLMRMGIKLKAGAKDTEIWAAVSSKGAKGFQAALSYAANTTEGQMFQLKNAVDEVNRSIGEGLLPNITSLAESMKTIAGLVESMPKGMRGNIILGGLAAGPILQITSAIIGLGEAWKIWKVISGIGKAGAGVAGKVLATGAAGDLASKVPGITKLLHPSLAARALGGLGVLGRGAAALVSPAIALPAAIGAAVSGLAIAGGSMLTSRRLAYEAGQPGGLIPGYTKGEIRYGKTAPIPAMTSKEAAQLHKDLQEIIKNTKETAKKTGTWG